MSEILSEKRSKYILKWIYEAVHGVWGTSKRISCGFSWENSGEMPNNNL